MTLAATAKQLGVSFYAYIYDRVTGARALPDLADIIRERTQLFILYPAGRLLKRASPFY
jgi:hypothetical protein